VKRLVDAGVSIIDVAGAGGTSWAGVEILRRSKVRPNARNARKQADEPGDIFWDWGIPTVDALRQVCSLKTQVPSLTVIASGGVTNGLEIGKSIAFGADLAGSARPMLRALETGGKDFLLSTISKWEHQLKGAMFLTGSRTIQDLQRQQLVLRA
jgi:isopentenyl-diphosphate delta-isomerase